MNRRHIAWAGLYLVALLLPWALGVWVARGSDAPPRPVWDDLAAGLGMVGFAGVLLSFVLLGRLRPLSTWVGSDRLMQAHQAFARVYLVLLVAHPFLYTLWRAPAGPPDAPALNIGPGDPALATGLLALGALLVLVASAVWRTRGRLRHEGWRLLHSALALAVLGLGLHHTLAAGQHARAAPVAAVWWGFAGVALATWLWVYLARPWWPGNRACRLHRLQRVAERIWWLELRPPPGGRPLRWRAGQFAWIQRRTRWPHRDNPFSICSAPDAHGTLAFLIKEAGDMTRALPSARSGEVFRVDGPHGRFEAPRTAPALVMHAGGIGVAPFVGLLADAVARRDARPIRLVYADRHAGQMVDVAALSGADGLADFRLVPVVEQPGPGWEGLTGRLDAAGLARVLDHPAVRPVAAEAWHLVCGPEPMMDAVESALVAHGVPAGHIVAEHFQYGFAGGSPLARRRRQLGALVPALALLAVVAERVLR